MFVTGTVTHLRWLHAQISKINAEFQKTSGSLSIGYSWANPGKAKNFPASNVPGNGSVAAWKPFEYWFGAALQHHGLVDMDKISAKSRCKLKT